MKTKIFYYSLDGNVKLVADGISAELSAENVCLKPVKDFSQKAFPKYFFGGKSVLFKENIPLISYEKIFDFDLILLGTPIWLGTFSSPMRTFLTQNDFSGKKSQFSLVPAAVEQKNALLSLKNCSRMLS
ncbi:MAG: hypothetical protein RR540_01545 [Oscillospiraceae bacterium]